MIHNQYSPLEVTTSPPQTKLKLETRLPRSSLWTSSGRTTLITTLRATVCTKCLCSIGVITWTWRSDSSPRESLLSRKRICTITLLPGTRSIWARYDVPVAIQPLKSGPRRSSDSRTISSRIPACSSCTGTARCCAMSTSTWATRRSCSWTSSRSEWRSRTHLSANGSRR